MKRKQMKTKEKKNPFDPTQPAIFCGIVDLYHFVGSKLVRCFLPWLAYCSPSDGLCCCVVGTISLCVAFRHLIRPLLTCHSVLPYVASLMHSSASLSC